MNTLEKVINNSITIKLKNDKVIKIKKISMKIMKEIKEIVAEKKTKINQNNFNANLKKITACKEAGLDVKIFTEDLFKAKTEVLSEEISEEELMQSLDEVSMFIKVLALLIDGEYSEDEIFEVFIENREAIFEGILKAFGMSSEKIKETKDTINKGLENNDSSKDLGESEKKL